MLRSTHRAAVTQLDQRHAHSKILQSEAHDRHLSMLRDRFQNLVDNEYIRARDEGRRQVHAWAVEVNSNLFYGTGPFQNMATWQRPRVGAALQEAEHQFQPTRTQLEETKENTDGTVRP